jgi:hypothetical protein
MIKKYSEWQRVNEVDELTEMTLTGKYINRIIEAYKKYPSSRPCRNIDKFPNAKGTQNLSDFVKGHAGKTSAEILEAVIEDWYMWPNTRSKDVLLGYIKNEDDLSNLAAWGLPFGKVIQADPTVISGLGLRGVVKSGAKATASIGKKLFGWVPKLIGVAESRQINEAGPLAAVGGFLLRAGAAILLSGAVRYTLYGKESLEDDPLVSWMTPYLPNIQGLVGDDPIIATYVATFNVGMMLIYDAWNLSMGQEKYGSDKNPIISWQGGNNYITQYYKDFYEQDNDIKNNFVNFMASLKSACMDDMKNPEKFRECPFYYTGERVRVIFEDEKFQDINLSDWQKWVRDNYQKYKLIPLAGSTSEFTAQERNSEFFPLMPLGIEGTPKGDPMREITIQFPNGSTTKISILQLELYLESSDIMNRYEVSSEDIINGGSSMVLKERQGPSKQQSIDPENLEFKDSDLVITSPSILKGSSFDQICDKLQNQDIESFAGMGQI